MKTPFDIEDRLLPAFKKLQFLPPLLARAVLSAAFFFSARRKFKDMESTAGFFKQLGIPRPELMARFVAANEITGATLLATGGFTRLATIPLMVILGVAIATARRQEIHSFSDLTGNFEFTYILLLTYLLVEGGGAASVDVLARKLLGGGLEPVQEKEEDSNIGEAA